HRERERGRTDAGRRAGADARAACRGAARAAAANRAGGGLRGTARRLRPRRRRARVRLAARRPGAAARALSGARNTTHVMRRAFAVLLAATMAAGCGHGSKQLPAGRYLVYN